MMRGGIKDIVNKVRMGWENDWKCSKMGFANVVHWKLVKGFLKKLV